MTNDIIRRVWEHKNDVVEGFTKRYGVHILVWYEAHCDVNVAISREKQIKAGSRRKKIALIIAMNPEWRDLYDDLV